MSESQRTRQTEMAGLVDELQGVKYHLQEALQKAQTVENLMVEALIREALEEVQIALDQVPQSR